jgi:hypothetical protein
VFGELDLYESVVYFVEGRTDMCGQWLFVEAVDCQLTADCGQCFCHII